MSAADRPLNRELVRGILRTLDHISDVSYLEEIVLLVSFPELFRTLSRMIGRRGRTRDMALLFLQDCLLLLPGPLNSELRAQFFGSALDREIRAFLQSPDDHFLRSRIGYFLGKTGAPGAVADLSGAVLAFAEKDPLVLPRWLFELRWLLQDEAMPVLDSLLSDLAGRSLYLTRWAVGQFYRDYRVPSGEILPAPDLDRLRRLAEDPVGVVREEAAFRLLELEFARDSPDLSQEQRRQRRQTIKQTRLRAEFAAIEIRFSNLLSESRCTDYSIPELLEFVQTFLDQSEHVDPAR